MTSGEFKMVPVDPTDDMMQAGYRVYGSTLYEPFSQGWGNAAIAIYRAMLAAAPAPAEAVAWARVTEGQITHLTTQQLPGYVPLAPPTDAEAVRRARDAALEEAARLVLASQGALGSVVLAERIMELSSQPPATEG